MASVSPTFVLRVLLLNPVILAGIFVLVLPLVIWGTHRFLAGGAAQAIEFFEVPGVPDAVGLRLYVPATGPECTGHHLWGLGFGQCDDFLLDYVAFARGQYHVSVVTGGPEEEPLDPPGLRDAVLNLASNAARRACEVREDPAKRSCR
jgi:hypothetical protein